MVGALSSHVGALLVGGGRCCNTADLAYYRSVAVARGWIQCDDWRVGAGFSVMIVVVVVVTVVVAGTRRGAGIPWLGQQQQQRQGSLMFV